jgi:hypothetical protein
MINNQSQVEEQEFINEVGTLVFQSAIMVFLATEGESKAEEFEDFVNKNVESNHFMEDLCEHYPEFEKILQEEMLAFQKKFALK